MDGHYSTKRKRDNDQIEVSKTGSTSALTEAVCSKQVVSRFIYDEGMGWGNAKGDVRPGRLGGDRSSCLVHVYSRI